MNQLYHKVLLAHNRDPHHFEKPACFCCHGKAYNPRCGDDLEIYVTSGDGDESSLQIYYTGEACAVAVASASRMSKALAGLSREQVEASCKAFIAAIENNSELQDQSLQTAMEPMMAVRQFSGRLGCATLAWKGTLSALSEHKKSL